MPTERLNAAGPGCPERAPEFEFLLDQLPGFAYRVRRADPWFLEYISDGVLAVTGYPAADLLTTRAQSTASIMDPADQAWFWPALQAALEGGQPYAFEYRIRTAAGATRWLLDKGRGLYADGVLVGAAGFATDITDRKQMEDDLRASRDERAAILEGLYDAVFVADVATGRILDVNSAATRLLNLPKDRLVGLQQTDLHPPDLRERILEAFRGHVAGAGPAEDLEVLTGDGRRVPVRISSNALYYRDGRPVIVGCFHDLSARRKAEQEAADLRRMTEVVLVNAKTHVAILAADLTLRYVDPGWRAAHGDWAGRTWREYFAWRPLPDATEQIRQAFTEQRTVRQEHVQPGGSERVVEVSAVFFMSAAGEPLVGYLEGDITEPRRAEQALRESESRYRRLFELESDAIVVIDNETCQILDANQAAERLYGYSRAELQARRSLDLSAEPDATRQVSRALSTRVPLRYHRRQDGTVFPAEITGSYFEEGGRTIHIAAIRDITARIAADSALRESARRLDSLLNNLPGFAFRCRNDADGTLEYVSDGVRAVTGYPASDFIGNRVRTLASIMHPGDAPRMTLEVNRAFATRQPFVLELRIRTATGEERWLWAKGRGVYDGDTVLASEGFASDITERRRAEAAQQALQAQLTQGQKMELVGRLAGGVAHDFNNLLTVILGCSAMAMEDTQEPQTLADLRQIHKAGERARSLTRQLLAFGRKQVLDLRRTTLNRIILDHLDMLKRLIGEDISIQTALQPDPWEISSDVAQMVQVLMNLAANARDAMPGGGTLHLRTANLEAPGGAAAALPGSAPGPQVLLEVADTGCGMDRETLKHLFEPFFTTKPVGEGAGLGLSTIQGIIEQHGGRIVCQSRRGQGTRFRIYLPPSATAAATEPAAVPTSTPPAGGAETILLVEDDPAVLKMTEAFLSRYGYQVVSAATPTEALQRVTTMARLDLLLSDVIMPEMNGRELSARVAALKPDAKVLYMSGYPGEVLSERGQLQKGIRLVPKPFTAAALIASVRETLDAPE
jgi:PAS domain S-box-containing protein